MDWDDIPIKPTASRLHGFMQGLAKRVATSPLSPNEREMYDALSDSTRPTAPSPIGPNDAPWVAAGAMMLEQARKEEPSTTRFLSGLVEGHGGRLESLDHRLKALPSLVRKMKAEGIPDPNEAAKAMSDTLRYTMVAPADKYTKTVKNVLDSMKDEGYAQRTKNLWRRGNAYMGLNVAMHTPNGHPFEVQFHTPQSYQTKKDIHPLYERFRVSDDNKVRRSLFEKMLGKSKDVEIPGGIEGLPTEVYRPYEDLPEMPKH